jgi:hypothetical protein
MAAGSGDRSLPCVRPGNKFGPLRPGFTLSSHNFRPHVEAVHDVACPFRSSRYHDKSTPSYFGCSSPSRRYSTFLSSAFRYLWFQY